MLHDYRRNMTPLKSLMTTCH